ncbi:MAG: LysR family transcriptional regulator, partial [Pseudomonadota bacterium]
MNWERLRFLRQVLAEGSYASAARRLGVSQPTVRRQIKALEDELGETLLLTTQTGIEPTAAARRMLPELDAMARSANRMSQFSFESTATPVVRIACGPWVGMFLCEHVSHLAGDPPDCTVEIATSVVSADMPRREADLALRMQRPDVSDLRSRSLPHFRYAIYGARSLVDDRPEAFDERRYTALPWATMTDELAHLPTAQWLLGRQVTNPTVRCTQSTQLHSAARS